MLTITEGYRAFNGHVFTQAQADRYNERCQYSELVKRLRGEDSEFYQNALNTQHMTFRVIIGLDY